MPIVGMKGDVEESLMQMLKREGQELEARFPVTVGTDELRILVERNRVKMR